ncbi:hypothetical protein [Enterococcus xiangfangensis]|uniref:RNA polymerase sigma-70 region 4 domain-containing protein n=1 Tax=Enterococcus xiangfangensis TaxID=1296537 RepID=A0ABU3FDJ4_9ENTE|nr:hypothetical protein [Enterococcus xiangfangensis]MDT2760753.1 hypothetical protein [Enterococcus xiangfangensis]
MIRGNTKEVKNIFRRSESYAVAAKIADELKKLPQFKNRFGWIDQQKAEINKEIDAMIDQLGDGKGKKVMRYKFIDGLSVDEIAVKTGIPSSYCYRLISKAYGEISLPTEKV